MWSSLAVTYRLPWATSVCVCGWVEGKEKGSPNSWFSLVRVIWHVFSSQENLLGWRLRRTHSAGQQFSGRVSKDCGCSSAPDIGASPQDFYSVRLLHGT